VGGGIVARGPWRVRFLVDETIERCPIFREVIVVTLVRFGGIPPVVGTTKIGCSRRNGPWVSGIACAVTFPRSSRKLAVKFDRSNVAVLLIVGFSHLAPLKVGLCCCECAILSF